MKYEILESKINSHTLEEIEELEINQNFFAVKCFYNLLKSEIKLSNELLEQLAYEVSLNEIKPLIKPKISGIHLSRERHTFVSKKIYDGKVYRLGEFKDYDKVAMRVINFCLAHEIDF